MFGDCFEFESEVDQQGAVVWGEVGSVVCFDVGDGVAPACGRDAVVKDVPCGAGDGVRKVSARSAVCGKFGWWLAEPCVDGSGCGFDEVAKEHGAGFGYFWVSSVAGWQMGFKRVGPK